MKNIANNRMHGVLFSCLAVVLILISACKDDTVDKPIVTSVRNYAASPEDTLVTIIKEEQWVVIEGQNLSSVSQIYFSTIPAQLNNALFSDHSIVVQIPAIPFQSVPPAEQNKIVVVNEGGTTTYEIDVTGKPMIERVRNFADAPKDIIVHSIVPGQQINLVGYNLKDATEISFMGILADLSNVVYTDTSAIVQVPVDLSGADATKVDLITYTTPIGSGTYSIKIIGPPVISGVSNENPTVGTTVIIYGHNFIDVNSLTFAGAAITDFEVADDKGSLSFVVNDLSQKGPVVITTAAGTFTTAYNVNDVVTGRFADFEWGDYFGWQWWGGASLTSNNSDFPGNASQYVSLNLIGLGADGGNSWSSAVRLTEKPWLAVENLNDPVANWALKFEVNIPNDWNGGSLIVESKYTSNFKVRIEPWQVTATKTAAFKTNGWLTITIPMTEFRKNDSTLGEGRGESLSNFSDLVGVEGKSEMYIYLRNYDSAPTQTGFYGAFDNIRIVKR